MRRIKLNVMQYVNLHAARSQAGESGLLPAPLLSAQDSFDRVHPQFTNIGQMRKRAMLRRMLFQEPQ